jgi:dienelactone hydrolase
MIAFHQCNVDCTFGKEAVVGKVIVRPDQAYGLELAQQGFVVLAPDVVNCGERNIPAIRQEGECLFRSSCSSQFLKHMGRSKEGKVIFDATRAVDVLQSLDFVDPERIGAIGHCSGGTETLLAMVADQRIKAGVASAVHGISVRGRGMIALIAPRFCMGLQGAYEGSPDNIKEVEDCYRFARGIYEGKGAPENLILRILPCGHHFLDQFKWEAYYKLKQHFGMAGVRESLLLKNILMSAQAGAWRYWTRDDKDTFLKLSDECYILANEEVLVRAFVALFYFLRGRCPDSSSLNVCVESDQGKCYVVCSILGDENPKGNYDHRLRDAEQFFVQSSGCLRRESIPDQVKYIVALQKTN